MVTYFSWTLSNKLKPNLNQNTKIFIKENAFENTVCEILAILFRPHNDKLLLNGLYFLCCRISLQPSTAVPWCRELSNTMTGSSEYLAEIPGRYKWDFNSLATGKSGSKFKSVIYEHKLQIRFMTTPYEIALRTPLMVSQHLFGQWFGAVRQQAIIWTNQC